MCVTSTSEYKTHIKVLPVLRFDICRSIIPLSKVTHQMWRDHPLSQGNKETKRAEGVEFGGDEGLGKKLKMG